MIKNKTQLQDEIANATLEAIYWWNRSENYYHNLFKRLDKIYKSKEHLSFFKNKIFDVFLREYSVRRNLSSGRKSIDMFIDLLFNEKTIFHSLQNGNDITIIDIFSNYVVEQRIITVNFFDKKKNEQITKYLSNDRKIISLLSKIAFLINPEKFFLYDTLAKKAITKTLTEYSLSKEKNNISYENYHYNLNLLKDYFNENKLFDSSFLILDKFKNTDAYSFFNENKEAFKNRIIDKFLWLKEINNERQAKKIKEEVINNSSYEFFLKNYF